MRLASISQLAASFGAALALAGERLYVDLVDINPPLIFVLNLIPAAIDRLTPINGPTALTLCTLGWIAIGPVLIFLLYRALLPLLHRAAARIAGRSGHHCAERSGMKVARVTARMRLPRVQWFTRRNQSRTRVTERIGWG